MPALYLASLAQMFKLLKASNEQLNTSPDAYYKEIEAIKTDIATNLKLGCINNLLKDFKAFNVFK